MIHGIKLKAFTATAIHLAVYSVFEGDFMFCKDRQHR